MTSSDNAETLLIQRIRQGDQDAWTELISRYEGRLLAFVEGRIRRRDVSEDVVQETFIGFLNSLPHFDGRRRLEAYLFSICAHKLTDYLRREGRRPILSLYAGTESDESLPQPAGRARVASSIARSGERKQLEETALCAALEEMIGRWRERGEWQKMVCIELLFVRGQANKDVADLLDLTEQQVANWKFDFLERLRACLKKQGLSEEVFPELGG